MKKIASTTIRLIGVNGEQVGVFNTSVALRMAYDANLDIIVVNDKVNPPVARMMDSGKMKYDREKKARKAKRNGSSKPKELRFGIGIEDNDINTKIRKIESILSKGTKVQITVVMKGREQSRPETAFDLLRRITSLVGNADASAPKRNGRNVVSMLTPKK